jgi:hypothetical protein
MPSFLHRRFIAGITLIAVVFAAMSPAVAAARYLSDPVAFAEICRAGSDVTGSGTPEPAGRAVRHDAPCAWCTVAEWQPPVERALTVVAAPAAECDALRLSGRSEHLPRDRAVLQSSNPRAPPQAL